MNHRIFCDRSASAGTLARRVLASLLLCPAGAWAEESPDLLTAPFNVSLGSFVLNSDTEVRLDGSSGQGSVVDWDRTFGGGDLTRFRIDGFWRFGERHKVRAMWFNSSRTKSRVLDEEIEWGDDVYPVNARTDSKFEFDVYELAYEYAFLQDEEYELAGTAGLHYTELSIGLSAKAELSNGTLEGDIAQEGSVGAPLPVLGLRGLARLPYDLWLDASAQWFALSIDEYDGSLWDLRIGLVWQPKPWLGIGAGYNQFSVDIDIEKDRYTGQLDWTYRGPMIYYSATF